MINYPSIIKTRNPIKGYEIIPPPNFPQQDLEIVDINAFPEAGNDVQSSWVSYKGISSVKTFKLNTSHYGVSSFSVSDRKDNHGRTAVQTAEVVIVPMNSYRDYLLDIYHNILGSLGISDNLIKIANFKAPQLWIPKYLRPTLILSYPYETQKQWQVVQATIIKSILSLYRSKLPTFSTLSLRPESNLDIVAIPLNEAKFIRINFTYLDIQATVDLLK